MGRKTKMNSITSPELIEQINPENKRLLDEFLEYLRSVQRSPGTIRGYKNDLEIFFVFCLQRLDNKPFVKVTKRDIIAYQNWLINEHENSPARVRRLKAAISSLSNYIERVLDEDEDYKGFRSIVNKIESPANQPVRDKTMLTEEQIEYLLNYLTENKQYDRACLLALAVYSGRRKSELVRFRVDDFKDENLVCDGALYKTSEPIKTKGFGLGKYIYCYTLARKFKPYFDTWMAYREENGIESEWLFPSPYNPKEQMKPDVLNGWARSFSKILGVDFYFHCLRHAFCTYLVRAGLPDGVIQEIIGWSSADMVKVYTDIESEERIAMWFKDGEINTENRGGFNNI